MQEATKKLIRTSVRNLLKNTDLSEYCIRKIVKAELEDPCSWGHPDHDDDPECAIRNYYGNLTSNNVLINFVDHMHRRYFFYYFKHTNKRSLN